MSRSTRILAIVTSLLTLAACKEIKVENGEVPDEYREMAKAYMGTYKGQMDGDAGALTLTLKGRKVVVTYKDAEGTDILEPSCGSKIGNVTKVKLSKDGKTYKLDSATIAFDPNACWPSVDGRELYLNFKKKNDKIQMAATILLRQEWEQRCRIDPGNPRAGIPPREICDNVPVASYAEGRFAK